MTSRCPTCNSPNPKRHPAQGFEGEVTLCTDAWHAPAQPEPAPGWCKHCRQYTIDEPLPSSADADWLRRVAVLAGVWPAHDESNCPAAITTAIEKYHTAMVAATTPRWLQPPHPPRAALTDFQRMQIIGDEFPLALVDPLVIAKVDAVCLAIEAAHGIGRAAQ